MTIKVNYTAYLVNDWELIFEKHLVFVQNFGLYSQLDCFNIFAYPKNEKILEIINKHGMEQKTNVIFQNENNYEFPAILDLVENPYDANLYFHTKGVSLKNNVHSYIPSLTWNDYMTYFNIVHFDSCLKMLNENDACGVEIASTAKGVFYCGNFWWSTKELMKKVRNSENFSKLKSMKNRYSAENIFFGIHGKYCELFNSGTRPEKSGSLYFYPFLDYTFDSEKKTCNNDLKIKEPKMDKSKVMIKFANERKYASYLEIGIFHGENFCKMNYPFSVKIGVDPNQSSPSTFHMTSDDFFEKFGSSMKFDLVFIDGMHLSEYVYRDIQNSLKALNPGGMIVCHDMLPKTEQMQTRDLGWYESGMRFPWNGDCWKAFAYTIPRCQFHCYTLDTDEGLGIIDTSLGRNPEEQDTGYMKEMSEMTWEDLNSDRDRIMNVKGLQFIGLR